MYRQAERRSSAPATSGWSSPKAARRPSTASRLTAMLFSTCPAARYRRPRFCRAPQVAGSCAPCRSRSRLTAASMASMASAWRPCSKTARPSPSRARALCRGSSVPLSSNWRYRLSAPARSPAAISLPAARISWIQLFASMFALLTYLFCRAVCVYVRPCWPHVAKTGSRSQPSVIPAAPAPQSRSRSMRRISTVRTCRITRGPCSHSQLSCSSLSP